MNGYMERKWINDLLIVRKMDDTKINGCIKGEMYGLTNLSILFQ